MLKNREKTAQASYVTIALAEDVELARDYVEMLKNSDIAARFLAHGDVVGESRVTIVVPEEFVEKAQRLIQARNSGSDFYDDICGDEVLDRVAEVED